ncbi:MAG: exo-alpha-sialidase [Alloprevotella sp.]|nr:exo-alpha-sialidase [Alloprevotella sp.]
MNKKNFTNTLRAIAAGMCFLVGAAANAQTETEAVTINVDLTTGELSSYSGSTSWFSHWKSALTNPQLEIDCGVNNMAKNGDGLVIASGQAKTSTYTYTPSNGWAVKAFSFTFKSRTASASVTIRTSDGKSVTATNSTATSVSATGLSGTAYFVVEDQANSVLEVSDWTVTLVPAEPAPDLGSVILFETRDNDPYPYRIPALVQAKNGNLIAVTDYRICGNDIGFGRVDLHARISKDNGLTWGEEFTIVEGTGTSGSWDCGFGDAACVADAESDDVLLMCVCGNVVYTSATRSNPGRIARLVSHDGGVTWSKPKDMTEDIFSLFDNNSLGALSGAFIGSGKLWQSEHIKVGKYRRIYAPMAARPNGNRVIYSDDLGETWAVLGDASDAPALAGDEPKCVELPDGSVLLTSRNSGGRVFNIFNYTDVENAKGYWTGAVTSSAATNGILTSGSSGNCNGANLLIPARRTSDGKSVYVLLQSLPFGPNRSNVGIFYKAIEDFNGIYSADSIAWNWEGRKQISQSSSAYSEMLLQQDGTIGFFFEENTSGNTYRYNMTYLRLTLEGITDGAYEMDLEGFSREAWIAEYAHQKYDHLLSENAAAPVGAVGTLSTEGREYIEGALTQFTQEPTATNAAAYNQSLFTGLQPMREGWFRVQSANAEGELNVGPNGTAMKAEAFNPCFADQIWLFAQNADGKYLITNANTSRYVGRTGNSGTSVQLQSRETAAGKYDVSVSPDGTCQLVCSNPSNTAYPSLMLDESGRVQSGQTAAAATKFYIVPVTDVTVAIGAGGLGTAFFPFALTAEAPQPAEASAAPAETGNPIFVPEVEVVEQTDGTQAARLAYDTGAPLEVLPANTPVFVLGTPGTSVTLHISEGDTPTEEGESNGLAAGKLSQITVRDGTEGRIYVLDRESAEPAFVHQATAPVHNEAYLVLPESLTTAESLPVETLDIVGILPTTLTPVPADTPAFDLLGRRAAAATRGSIRISKGRKILTQ